MQATASLEEGENFVFRLATNAREAIKIGLAITLAYYLAMRLSWVSPSWAAISVAFISLPTAGQSLNKGFLRMGGTLLALVAGLFYLGLFPQDRWLFFISFTPFLAFVTYKMLGKNGQYFWYCTGFVSMMITTAGPASSEHAFEFAVFRTLETLIGIVIWTLVSVLIWPRTNRQGLKKVSHELLVTQEKLTRCYRNRIAGRDSGESLRSLRSQEGQLVGQLSQTIEAAGSESYEVHEVRHLWERLQRLSFSMMGVLDRLHTGLTDLQQIDLEKVLPDLGVLFSELSSRFEEMQRVLSGRPPARPCEVISLSPAHRDSQVLNHFQRAAVEVTRTELERLEALTRAMVECVRDLEQYRAEKQRPVAVAGSGPVSGRFGLPPLDPDRVRGVIMVVLSMWAGSLIWIYINPPGHAMWYQFVPNIALSAVQHPQVRFTLLKPFAFAYVAGLVTYVFIMPHLTVFWELGIVIFTFVFVAAYFFPGVGRIALLLAMFNMLGINNEQTYSFGSMANAFVFTMLGLALVLALTYVTRSPRQEEGFMSMVCRLFRSCEFLVSRVAESGQSGSLLEGMKIAYYRQEMGSLPTKLGIWGKQIDRKKFPNNTPDQVKDLVANLQVLVYRVEELIEARSAPQASILMRELSDEVRAWRIVVEQGFARWSEYPEAESADDLRERLSLRLARLNAGIEETMNRAGEEELSDEERRNFYRLLGSFRGVSQAAIAYAGAAGSIDWAHWREERF